MYNKWNKNKELLEKIEAIVAESYSIAAVLKKLEMDVSGANYKGFKSACKKLNISTEHFTGQGHLKNKTHKWAKTKTFEEILVKNSDYLNTSNLKQRLFKANLLHKKCYICNLTDWQNKPLSLQIDHINGDNTDNRLENLRILCPNCHSQTDTYSGKNK